jgi:hypothetical protein
MIKHTSKSLRKMTVSNNDTVQYFWMNSEICLNDYLSKKVTLRWTGNIHCVACDSLTKKSFGQGFCYPCFMKSPENSECIIRPELCRAHLGEGRDIEWEEKNHNQKHYVYLAASDAVKVGVTRTTQIPTRWIDQGAKKAIILAETPNRYLAGVIEVALKDFFTDKTNWQRMLKNEINESIDLVEEKWNLEGQLPSDLSMYFTDDDEELELHFPVLQYPQKVKSLSFDKTSIVEGILMGIKGQYLIFNDGSVINIRKHSGYEVELELNT